MDDLTQGPLLLEFNQYPENLFRAPNEDLKPEDVTRLLMEDMRLPSEAQENKMYSVNDFELPEAATLSNTAILEEIYKLRRELAHFQQEVRTSFASMDYKKLKKNRTLKNRCTFINRRNESCRGYICKIPGSQLCYAHHVLSTSHNNSERRKKLY